MPKLIGWRLKPASCWLAISFVGAIIACSYLLSAYWSHHLLSLHGQQIGAIKDSTETLQCSKYLDRKIIILQWTTYFWKNESEYGFGGAPFDRCDHNRSVVCLMTMDRSLVNESDAIIFHIRDLNPNDLPPAGWRRPHQHYIFFFYESPMHTDMAKLRLPVFQHFFNRTMTYRRDSDILDLHPYGRVKCINTSSRPCLNYPRLDDSPVVEDIFESAKNPFRIDLSSKNRTVAWFATNCNTDSRRESLVHNLSLFIAVDIYGSCGNGSHRCANRADCDLMLNRYYRFYLSFENSLCTDYVTEKLYRPMDHDTVPVVYGEADYSSYLPAGSYVDARGFDSPQSLANHLNRLMNDDELYLSYFAWRRKYVVDRTPGNGICQLCRLLSDENTKEKSYPDIATWWYSVNQTCRSPPASLV
ncbi:alpha-(1,3)-fucosyltransferase C-like [Daphnia carinata]|uniref:alpha-(1,3)-fucosyltransferase C-like n=1 Tax=Daphnia carinata TaxID=120202 RepID=UPI00258003BE|nr:alpha-(1,3)-fucosyltransferase C-like [Daphnia carinata]